MAPAAHESHMTTDHKTIRHWVEQRGGQPASVKGTGDGGDVGILRVDFPHFGAEESLSAISWEEFFRKFDERDLAFLYQEQTKSGEMSRFFKFVRRDQVH